MAAAGAFKARRVAECVYKVHTRACGVRAAARPDESGRGWEECGRYTGSRIVEETPRSLGEIVDAKKKKGRNQLGISFSILRSRP